MTRAGFSKQTYGTHRKGNVRMYVTGKPERKGLLGRQRPRRQ